MSITASNLCWQLPESAITKTELLVLLSLVKFLRDDEVRQKPTSAMCFPSIERVSRDTKMSRRHAIRMLKALEDKQMINIERRKDRSSHYHVLLGNIRRELSTSVSQTDDTKSGYETNLTLPSDIQFTSNDKVSPITSTNNNINNNKLSLVPKNLDKLDNRSEKLKRKAVRDSLRDIEDTDW